MEYTRFGEVIIRRENSEFEWENVLESDIVDASVSVGISEAFRELNMAQGPSRLALLITRSPQNGVIAEKLGITADELADRLARPGDNQGTMLRVPEEDFDNLMAELGLSPEEGRARFNGTFWL